MKSIINFIFSIGYRCYSSEFLTHFKLRKMSGPFDFIFIDIESALNIINNNFDNYLFDIISFNKNTRNVELFYKKNTNEINNKYYELLENNIGYMAHDYSGINLILNQNYIDNCKLSNNLYNWDKICCFLHQDILDNYIYNLIKKRCERFNLIYNKYNNTTVLLYITQIVNSNNIEDYMNLIIELKKKNNINCFIIMIINSDNLEETHYFNEIERCLFIIKKVENYDIQYLKYQTDNNLNYEKELNIILKYFEFNLFEKENI